MKFRPRFSFRAGRTVAVKAADPLVGAALRSRDIDFDVAREFQALGSGQVASWEATGTKAARSAHVAAAAARPLARGVGELIPVAHRRVETTATAWDGASERLHGNQPLTDAERWRYRITQTLLLVGDFCGVMGASVAHGEIPAIAAGQAVASGMAAVTSGLVAAELRKRQMAHLFRVEQPSADGESAPFTVFGLDPDDLALRVALVLVGAITLGICTLRLSVEGLSSGVAYGALAFATCAASYINSWVHARPAAEVLDGYRQAHQEAVGGYLSLAGHEALTREAVALSEAGSIEAEHAARGEAMRQNLLAQLRAVMRAHPGIFGHGTQARSGPTAVPLRPVPVERRPIERPNSVRVRAPMADAHHVAAERR